MTLTGVELPPVGALVRGYPDPPLSHPCSPSPTNTTGLELHDYICLAHRRGFVLGQRPGVGFSVSKYL